MAYPDDQEPDARASFPPGYEEVEELVKEAEARVSEIEEQIKQVPPDQGPAPQLNPPGFVRSRQAGSHARQVDALRQQQAQVRAGAMERVDGAAARADPATGKLVRETAANRLYQVETKNADAPGKQAIKTASRDLEASQEYAQDKLQARADERSSAGAPEQPTEERSTSLSLRFSQPLSYTKHTQGPGKTPEKSQQPERTHPEPERE